MTCLMNPPFTGNLHLRILQEALKHCSTVVNLSPVRWLQDPFKEYKKGSDFEKFSKLRGKIKDIELINAAKARKLFNIQVVDLGVYSFDGKTYNKTFFEENSIINKVLDAIYKKHLTSIKDVSHKETKPEGNFNYVLEVYGGNMKTGSGWVKPLDYEMRSSSLAKHQNTSKDTYIVCRQQTAEECVNFYNSTKTNFFCYLDKASRVDLRVFPQFYPFMGNVVNPRTGLLGYKGPWEDEDFFNFFELNEEERNIVLNTMEKYNTK